MATKVILDVDTGTDDAVALMLAALSPDLELVGATTVDGNTAVHICTENTLRVFETIGAPILVYQGCPGAMVTSLTPGRRAENPHATPSKIHGDYLDLPPAHSKAAEQHAVSWLIETYLKSDGDITLVPTGPLTNIAMAMRLEPRILPKIPEIVLMGGGYQVFNITPAAEFNFWVDPEAAKIVMNCGRPIRVVPLDATHRALVSMEDCVELRNIGSPAAIASAMLIEKRITGYGKVQPMERSHTVPVHDALAVCAVIDPSVIETQFVHVDVEINGGITDGQSLCDVTRRSTRQPNAHLALDADEKKFVGMLKQILSRTC